LRIEAYFDAVRAVIDGCLWMQSSSVQFDQRAIYQGFLRGEIYFMDGSMLHVREFVDTELEIDRLTYSYQYMDRTQRLIFRYDNTGHHRRLNLPTYPHHKHDGSEANVVSSSAPTLAEVLDEIGALIRLPPEAYGL
jgi:hypothetical protein